jgi:hypothetical protein
MTPKPEEDDLAIPEFLDRRKWTGACTWCDALFRTRAELAEHMREEHGEDVWHNAS